MRARVSLVLVVLTVAGCGDKKADTPVNATAAKPATPDTSRQEARLRRDGGTVATYAFLKRPGAPSTPAKARESLTIIRRRLAALGPGDAAVFPRRLDADRVVLACIACSDSSPTDFVATPGHLAFYDWEPNVVDHSCNTRPADDSLTGGSDAGAPRFGHTRAEAAAIVNRCRKRGFATVMARAEGPDPAGARALDSWFVVRDRPALDGDAIRDPEQSFTQGDQKPNVIFGFTPEGGDAWQRATRKIAERGAKLAARKRKDPGGEAPYQHFAIILDDRVLSVPYVDYEANPDGIAGTNGSEISGGFTVARARQLAATLRYGRLPAPLTLLKVEAVVPG